MHFGLLTCAGYLEEQKCEEAARSFLQLSPHLQECRMVNSAGRRFSTKVNGFTLVEILEKFCAANAMSTKFIKLQSINNPAIFFCSLIFFSQQKQHKNTQNQVAMKFYLFDCYNMISIILTFFFLLSQFRKD